jgi:predicted RNA methylase
MTSRMDYNNPHGDGELGLPYHYEMVSDTVRVTPFRQAIQNTCKGKIVLESGTGTSILSLIAAGAGAKMVYAIELDPNIAAFARKNIEKSGFKNIKLIEKNTLQVTTADLDGNKAEVLIAENLSTWEVTEPQIQVMNHMVKNLAVANPISIPHLIENKLELCFSTYVFEKVIELRTMYFQFSGIPSPELFSDPVVFENVEMNRINPISFEKDILIPVKKSGIINGIRLTSPLIVGEKVVFQSSDSLMPPVIIPLPNDIKVEKGQTIKIKIQYQTNTDWNQFHCQVIK